MTAALVGVAAVLYFMNRRLRRSRPDLSIAAPLLVAMLARIVVAAGITMLGLDDLRGGDEDAFLRSAALISQEPFGSTEWQQALTTDLHKFILAVQVTLLHPPELALRVVWSGISVAGLGLLATAVYDLAGRRAASIAAWVIALEPANVFFSEVLHKEAIMLLAIGLVTLAGVAVWRRPGVRPLVPMAVGCLIALATRQYVGLLLVAAAAAIVFHAGMRHRVRARPRSLRLVMAALLVAILAVPAVGTLARPATFEELQSTQTSEVARSDVNLPLEPVDFSSPTAVALHLPQRIRDVVFRPYPWQLANKAQRFGLVGTLVVFVVVALLAFELVGSRGRIMERAGPLVYVSSALLIAYAVTATNAGIAFRHRTQLVALAVCLLVTLRGARLRERKSEPVPWRAGRLLRLAPQASPARGRV